MIIRKGYLIYKNNNFIRLSCEEALDLIEEYRIN